MNIATLEFVECFFDMEKYVFRIIKLIIPMWNLIRQLEILYRKIINNKYSQVFNKTCIYIINIFYA